MSSYKHVLFAGIVNVAGMPDTGKTTFALESGAPPDKVCFIDDDLKGQAIALELENIGKPFGKYVNLVAETKGMLENEFHKYCIDLIEGLEDNKYEVIIWDNFSRFENSFHPWVSTHQKQFKEKWSPMGVIHGAEIWLASFDYEARVLDEMQRKAPLVIITSHMKSENVSGRRTGKMIPDVKRGLLQKSLLRVLLRRSDDGSPIPTGIILKRIAKREVTDEGIKVINVLPQKVVHFNWEKIRYYFDDPIGNRAPTQDEMPNEFELSMLDSTVITDDQRLIMRLAIEGAADEEESDGAKEMVAQMKAMRDAGSTLPEIAQAFDTDVKTVVGLIKN